jgi:DNA-binding MarR family transcriptional regulator
MVGGIFDVAGFSYFICVAKPVDVAGLLLGSAILSMESVFIRCTVVKMDPNANVELNKLLGLDKIIHERLRLGIMVALSVSESLTFQELKQTLKATDGNLSVHLRLLENHGYISVEKKFIDRKPCSTYRLSPQGKSLFQEYIRQLEKLIQEIQQHE